MNYCFDIDGTICTNTDGSYEDAKSYPEVIAKINALFDEGHKIVLYTARGSTTGIDWSDFTKKQVQGWGVKFHELYTGKPHADIYIDDKGKNYFDWRTEFVSQEPVVKQTNNQSILQNEIYLKTTYSSDRAPKNQYPSQLATWLLKNAYKSTGRILDLGCGMGDHLTAFSQLGFDVAGVDISPIIMQQKHSFPVKVADLEVDPPPFQAESFDFIFSKSVIEHSRVPTVLMKKSFDMLQPGGVGVFMTPSWEYNYKAAFYIDHTHVTPFTAASLSDALSMVGFEEIQVQYFYQLPVLWRYPILKPFIKFVSWLPIPYQPVKKTNLPFGINKFIRFSKEVMLLAICKKPE